MSSLHIDPTRTALLRRRFMMAMTQRFNVLKHKIMQLVAVEDAFGIHKGVFNPFIPHHTLNARWSFNTDTQKLEQFKMWLRSQIAIDLLRSDGDDVWLQEYIQGAYARGMENTFAQLRQAPQADKKKMDFYQGSRQEFLRSAFTRPVSVEKVKLLAGRSYTELQGITDVMSQQIGRELVNGLIQGMSPRQVAVAMNAKVNGIGLSRALTLARTETIAAHAEGQLDAYENLGAEQVGIAVEWSVSGVGRTRKGNPSPCKKCAHMAKTVLTIEEARGLIPAHPNCMCSFIPANVGEKTKSQIRSQQRILASLRKAGLTGKISQRRPRSIFS